MTQQIPQPIGASDTAITQRLARFGLQHHDQLDVVQVVAARAAMAKLRNPAGWLRVALTNAAIDCRRRRECSMPAGFADAFVSADDPVANVIRDEIIAEVQAALERLEPPLAAILIGYATGLERAEIARNVGYSARHVHRLYCLGRDRIRSMLHHHDCSRPS